MNKGVVYFLSDDKTYVLSRTVNLDTFCWGSGKYTEDKLEALREVEEYLERKLRIIKSDIEKEIESREVCPDCKAKLIKVRQSSNSYLSTNQFNAIKAGDYYCSDCADKTTKSGFKYFWEKDLGIK